MKAYSGNTCGCKLFHFRKQYGKIGVCCHSGLAERNFEYHVNFMFCNYRLSGNYK